MILLTSAAYISPALISEFGKLPPTMLPVQNKRLYEHQIQLIKKEKFGDVYLTLPQRYRLTDVDARKLLDFGVKTVYIPENFSLGQSVVYALNVIGRYDEELYIFHGDTLFSSLTTEVDVFSINRAEDDYLWTPIYDSTDPDVYSGFFSFSSISLLIKTITENDYNFMSGLTAYAKERTMKGVSLPDWMDFGLLNTYYRSISKLTTQRVFNSLKVSRYSLTKYSKDARKILAEANWFLSLPTQMRHYAPAIWDSGISEDGQGYYEIEYYFQSSLASLFVFGRNPIFIWKEILDTCAKYIADETLFRPSDLLEVSNQSRALFGPKTHIRLKEYSKTSGVDLNQSWVINGVSVPSLKQIIHELDHEIDMSGSEFSTLMHGDFCFSNILYDFKSKSIRVLDPRGMDVDGNQTIYGDLRYDVAKLAHSVLGMYDYIIGGSFTYLETDPYQVSISFPQSSTIDEIQEYFRLMSFAGYTLKQLSVYPIMIHLFLSMLPLHSDKPERQKAMLANALRLYVEYKTMH